MGPSPEAALLVTVTVCVERAILRRRGVLASRGQIQSSVAKKSRPIELQPVRDGRPRKRLRSSVPDGGVWCSTKKLEGFDIQFPPPATIRLLSTILLLQTARIRGRSCTFNLRHSKESAHDGDPQRPYRRLCRGSQPVHPTLQERKEGMEKKRRCDRGSERSSRSQ